MKVNFDGMRRNATNSMNELFTEIEILFENDLLAEEYRESLIAAFNEAAQSVDIFNCLEDDKEEDFNTLDIDIKRFE